jgi:multicomponent Na+:H+ antiporter subunit C
MNFLGLINYWIAICIILTGLYGVLAKRNLIKQAIALGLFQTGVFLFYVAMGVYNDPGGQLAGAPIWKAVDGVKVDMPFDNPLPHVLMLTAIVVSVATLAVAVALIVNIKRAYGTVEEDEIAAQEEFI